MRRFPAVDERGTPAFDLMTGQTSTPLHELIVRECELEDLAARFYDRDLWPTHPAPSREAPR